MMLPHLRTRLFVFLNCLVGLFVIQRGGIVFEEDMQTKNASGTGRNASNAVVGGDDNGILPLQFSANENLIVQRQKGIYLNGTAPTAHLLRNVLLITAANSAYLDMYRNWACYAKRLGLKWVFVAMDEAVYQAVKVETNPHEEVLLGYDGSTLNNITQQVNFRDPRFNILSCNKLLMVLRTIHSSHVDVVFSDPDNVFLKDPFAMGTSLGDLIQSGDYEYIYQPNKGRAPKTNNWRTKEPMEANTGFYFVSGTKKRSGIQSLFVSAMDACRTHPELDDQANFWSTLRQMRNGSLRKDWNENGLSTDDEHQGVMVVGEPFHNASFCAAAQNKHTLSYCPMDPFQHPTGWATTIQNLSNQGVVVTYHANFAVGKEKKLKKLRNAGAWSWSNDDCACSIPMGQRSTAT